MKTKSHVLKSELPEEKCCHTRTGDVSSERMAAEVEVGLLSFLRPVSRNGSSEVLGVPRDGGQRLRKKHFRPALVARRDRRGRHF